MRSWLAPRLSFCSFELRCPHRQGCDASLLINSTPKNSAEKDAGANLTVRGYDLIDAAKAAVEKACPGKVSCADIIALATRDVIALVCIVVTFPHHRHYPPQSHFKPYIHQTLWRILWIWQPHGTLIFKEASVWIYLLRQILKKNIVIYCSLEGRNSQCRPVVETGASPKLPMWTCQALHWAWPTRPGLSLHKAWPRTTWLPFSVSHQ